MNFSLNILEILCLNPLIFLYNRNEIIIILINFSLNICKNLLYMRDFMFF